MNKNKDQNFSIIDANIAAYAALAMVHVKELNKYENYVTTSYKDTAIKNLESLNNLFQKYKEEPTLIPIEEIDHIHNGIRRITNICYILYESSVNEYHFKMIDISLHNLIDKLDYIRNIYFPDRKEEEEDD